MVIKQGDSLPDLVVDLSGQAGPEDLTSATGIRALGVRDGALVVDRSVTGDAQGVVTMAWEGETSVPGLIGFEFEVTWPGGRKQTFPADGREYVLVVPDADGGSQ